MVSSVLGRALLSPCQYLHTHDDGECWVWPRSCTMSTLPLQHPPLPQPCMSTRQSTWWVRRHLYGLPAPPASAAPQPCWEPSPEHIRDGAALREAVGGGRKGKAQGWLIQLRSYRAMGYRQSQKHPSDFGAEGLWHPNPFGAPPNTLKEPKLQALPQQTRACPLHTQQPVPHLKHTDRLGYTELLGAESTWDFSPTKPR